MLSIDTNILLYAFNKDANQHVAAYQWLLAQQQQEDVAISEFVLAELYTLLRNPVVLPHPLSAPDAADVVQHYRRHPRWQLIGFAEDSRALHDVRTALTLIHHGVTEFATANVKDFEGLGFRRVWNPLTRMSPRRGG